MRRSIQILCVPLLVALMLAGACKKEPGSKEAAVPGLSDERGPQQIPANLDQNLAILDQVPADSPFLIAAITPMPDPLFDWLAQGLAPIASFLQEQLTAAKQETDEPIARALLDALDGKLSIEGMESLGLSLRPRYALYAIGLSLAFRIELTDGKRLEAVIAGLESRAEKPPTRETLGAVSYRLWLEDEVAMVMAIIDNELVAGIMHSDARQAILPVLLGVEKPAASIRGTIREAIVQNGLGGVALFHLDLTSVARIFTGEASALTRETMTRSGVDLAELPAACSLEITALARVMPRMLFDYTRLTAESFEGSMFVELRPDLARSLAAMAAPGVALSHLSRSKPLMAMGVSMNVNKALESARESARDVAREPYQCEYLTWLNEAAQALAEDDQEMPELLTQGGFKGGVLVLEEFENTGFVPTGKGFAALALDNKTPLLALAREALPQLAALDPGAREATLSVPVGLPNLESVDVVIHSSWLGAAVGAGMTEALKGFVGAAPGSSEPMFVMGYDSVEFMKLTGSPGASGLQETRIYEALMSMASYTFMEMYPTDRGFTITYSMQRR